MEKEQTKKQGGLTLDELATYSQDVLLPAMDKRFAKPNAAKVIAHYLLEYLLI